MPLVKRIHGRGVRSGVVEANGEVLFAPGAMVPRWTRRFTDAIKEGAEKAAPSNKRPRWAHYGVPLKKSFTATTKPDPLRMKVHAAIGSHAHYSLFVDQGTKDHMAKILPPWTGRGLPLYEHTQWIPGTRKQRGEIPVSGQKGQNFFNYGMRFGFARMRMVEGASPEAAVRAAVEQTVHTLPDFLGNTPVDAAFKVQLEAWRDERTAAFRSKARRRTSAERRARHEKTATSPVAKPSPLTKKQQSRHTDAEIARVKSQMLAKKNEIKERSLREEEAKQKKATQDLIKENQNRHFVAVAQQAVNFLARIKQAYPDAKMLQTKRDGVVVKFTVQYTLGDGSVQNQEFPI